MDRLRADALTDARALRLLHRAHGRLPATRPTRKPWEPGYIDVTTHLKPSEALPDAGERNGRRVA